MTPIAVYSSSLFKARNSTCDDKLFDALSKVKNEKKIQIEIFIGGSV